MSLDQIAIKHGTDKASQHPVKGHGYTEHYSRAFEHLRTYPGKLLEIGVGGGESIRTWLEYFPVMRVFGVDNYQGTNPWNTVGARPDPRYHFVYGDQSSDVFWKCFLADYGSDWTILIDDGGHFSNQVVTTWVMMWPHMAPGGLYCIEDFGVAYSPGTIFCPTGWPTHQELIKGFIDQIHQIGDIDSMAISRELAILKRSG